MNRLLLITLGAAACTGGTSGPTTAPAGDPPRNAVTVTARDTIGNAPLPGATIRIDDRQGVTDAFGAVTLDVRRGPQVVTVAHPDYDAGSGSVLVATAPVRTDVTVRRAAPLVLRCVQSGGVLRAHVIDLAGRKSILRRALSHVDFQVDGQAGTVPSTRWRWIVVDDLTWEAVVEDLPPGAGQIQWSVFDRERNVRRQGCLPTS